jgi:hypothetical protein
MAALALSNRIASDASALAALHGRKPADDGSTAPM